MGARPPPAAASPATGTNGPAASLQPCCRRERAMHREDLREVRGDDERVLIAVAGILAAEFSWRYSEIQLIQQRGPARRSPGS